jgi:hypothetical protein
LRKVIGHQASGADTNNAGGLAKDFTDRAVQRPRVRAAVGEQNNQTGMSPLQVVQM